MRFDSSRTRQVATPSLQGLPIGLRLCMSDTLKRRIPHLRSTSEHRISAHRQQKKKKKKRIFQEATKSTSQLDPMR